MCRKTECFRPLAQEENEGLAKVWNTSMAGFYSYGEYGQKTANMRFIPQPAAG
jgi:hypothetical protein